MQLGFRRSKHGERHQVVDRMGNITSASCNLFMKMLQESIETIVKKHIDKTTKNVPLGIILYAIPFVYTLKIVNAT